MAKSSLDPAARPLLALDTSTRAGSVAVQAPDGRILAERSSEVSTHSESLLAMIDAALGDAGVELGGLAAIACGAGPGSFTGLRIGLATAKGLCFASARPLLLISSLAALAAQGPAGALAIACLDARKGEVFLGPFIDGQPIDEERAARPEGVAILLAGWRAAAVGRGAPEELILIGDAPARYPELATLARWVRATPGAAALARLARRRLERGEQDDLDAATPRYIRPPEITSPRQKP
jgi:tRNA threonylcarbamoyladenosine biosynthesis protein TsaB